jgi:hypothetical protein
MKKLAHESDWEKQEEHQQRGLKCSHDCGRCVFLYSNLCIGYGYRFHFDFL